MTTLPPPDADVVVVGCGISGLLTAFHIRKLHTVLFERMKSIGREHCTGLVTLPTLKRIPLANRFVESYYRTMYVVIPNFVTIEIRCSSPFLYKINRVLHERTLAEVITSNIGHELYTGYYVIGVQVSKNRLVVIAKNKEGIARIYAKHVVIAEGYPPRIAKTFGLSGTSTSFIALQRIVRVRTPVESDSIGVIYSPNTIRGFVWVVPLDDRHALVGAAYRQQKTRALLEYLWNTLGEPLSKPFGGFVLRGAPRSIHRDNVYGVGDCLPMSKSFSGGGLYAISIASYAIAKSIESENPTYLKKLKKLIRELKVSLYASTIIDRAIGCLRLFKTSESLLRITTTMSGYDYDSTPRTISKLLLSLLRR